MYKNKINNLKNISNILVSKQNKKANKIYAHYQQIFKDKNKLIYLLDQLLEHIYTNKSQKIK
jgi:hypothetical protein